MQANTNFSEKALLQKIGVNKVPYQEGTKMQKSC